MYKHADITEHASGGTAKPKGGLTVNLPVDLIERIGLGVVSVEGIPFDFKRQDGVILTPIAQPPRLD